jgi:SAM-dependent methyltransferase
MKRRKLRKRIRKLLRLGGGYQSDRSEGTEERWRLIRSHLDEDDRSLLDVGCNLGVMTRRAADAGRFALGIEPGRDLVRAAMAKAAKTKSAAFMHFEVDPSSVLLLPRFDVTLCLSVQHYWMRSFGEEAAWRIVGELLRRTDRKMFFEPASIKSKYGNPDLPFEDLDRDAIVEYNVKKLQSLLPEGGSVEHLGETPCLGREPFRLMFLVDRSP